MVQRGHDGKSTSIKRKEKKDIRKTSGDGSRGGRGTATCQVVQKGKKGRKGKKKAQNTIKE